MLLCPRPYMPTCTYSTAPQRGTVRHSIHLLPHPRRRPALHHNHHHHLLLLPRPTPPGADPLMILIIMTAIDLAVEVTYQASLRAYPRERSRPCRWATTSWHAGTQAVLFCHISQLSDRTGRDARDPVHMFDGAEDAREVPVKPVSNQLNPTRGQRARGDVLPHRRRSAGPASTSADTCASEATLDVRIFPRIPGNLASWRIRQTRRRRAPRASRASASRLAVALTRRGGACDLSPTATGKLHARSSPRR